MSKVPQSLYSFLLMSAFVGSISLAGQSLDVRLADEPFKERRDDFVITLRSNKALDRLILSRVEVTNAKILSNSVQRLDAYSFSFRAQLVSANLKAQITILKGGLRATDSSRNEEAFSLNFPNETAKIFLEAGDNGVLGQNVLWVDDDGVQAKAAGIQNSFSDIQLALRAAVSGATVRVLPGVYPRMLNITMKSVRLVAMKDADNEVNPRGNPANQDWPVIIDAAGQPNGIQTAWGVDDVTIRGFRIRNPEGNGIYIKPSIETQFPKNRIFMDFNERVSVIGNFIEGAGMDGIKAHQALSLRIEGNRIDNWSQKYMTGVKGFDLEHGIDFVGVGNSVIRNNLFGDGAIGMTVKSGSVNVLVEDNKFLGKLAWLSLSMGEGCNTEERAMFASAQVSSGVCRYLTKSVLVRGNTFTGNAYDVKLYGCQNCTFLKNTFGKGTIITQSNEGGKNQNICFDVTPKLDEKRGGFSQVGVFSEGSCQTEFPIATKVVDPYGGFDLK